MFHLQYLWFPVPFRSPVLYVNVLNFFNWFVVLGFFRRCRWPFGWCIDFACRWSLVVMFGPLFCDDLCFPIGLLTWGNGSVADCLFVLGFNWLLYCVWLVCFCSVWRYKLFLVLGFGKSVRSHGWCRDYGLVR